MPAITGKDYILRINQLKANIWHEGKKIIGNISEHPTYKGAIKSQAMLYDLQHQEDVKDLMTYFSPQTGDRVGTSFLQPKTKEDLTKRRKMTMEWAKTNGGMLGRSPDYMNTVLMSFAASASILEGKENCFPENLVHFYEQAREQDLSFTHTFINPQVNRSQLYFEDAEEPISATIIDKNKEGLVVKGAKLLATQGGMTDELLVLSPGGITSKANAFAFSVPSDINGLKFITRESFVNGESSFNYPLSSRFEEIDTIVVFDDVVVPWERVFFYDNLEVANSFKNQSAFLPFTLHQVVCRQVVKTKFLLGVAQSIVDTINISEYQHIQEKVTEIIVALETMEALLTKAEWNASIDEFGLMRPELAPLQVASCTYPTVYSKLTEIIQILGSSGMISIPTEKDFNSEIRGDLTKYLQSATKDGKERVQLFRLAWDLTMSAFGTRQTQYERFFFGHPIRLTSELYHSYDKTEYINLIHKFLKSKG
ncbi:4-hydroxyphenylacetate 3-monooxygenase, oxygenase component [Aquibacillus albus]|uniref:4-hydroxyphenylacetate 3-monooxygenase n=1 Tax=Aquibacillus albus TaxID=1168171 RepID=A0ABS2N0H2_9BACI|nr:4-hydroxyphenylacetate 3-monooxygenase, oxygenase component [Aquibacillus albus]MBM7571639.1 4-hydroxyphenylacetate 3-monooxygenase [Aquibacillus albus]